MTAEKSEKSTLADLILFLFTVCEKTVYLHFPVMLFGLLDSKFKEMCTVIHPSFFDTYIFKNSACFCCCYCDPFQKTEIKPINFTNIWTLFPITLVNIKNRS